MLEEKALRLGGPALGAPVQGLPHCAVHVWCRQATEPNCAKCFAVL